MSLLQDLLGSGALWSKRPVFGYLMGGCRDAGFGVYAKCGILRKLLKRRWAGKRPQGSVALSFVSTVRCDTCGMAAKLLPSGKAPSRPF